MLYTSLSFRWVGETTDNRLDHQSAEMNETRMFTAMDDNMDGQLTEDELTGMLGSRMRAGFGRMDLDGNGSVDMEEYVTVNRMMRARGQQ